MAGSLAAREILSDMHRLSSRVLLPGAVLVLGLALTACGGEDEVASPASGTSPSATASEEPTEAPEPSEEPAPEPEPEPEGVVVDITIEGGTVTPAGDRIQVDVGETVVLAISADAPGELHAHTTEELYLDYPAGESEQEIVLDQPGIVEVESHDLGVVIVQLQAS